MACTWSKSTYLAIYGIPRLELGNIPQKNRKEGIFVIPVSKSSEKFYTGKPTYRKNTGIPSKYRYTVKISVWTSTYIH